MADSSSAASSSQQIVDIQDGPDELGENTFQSFVEEAREVSGIIASLDAQRYEQKSYSRLTTILEKYQEQPQLLDPHLESIVQPLMYLVSHNMSDMKFLHSLFKVLYTITKVRGYKTVVKFFPHEVVDLEPAFELLERQDSKDTETWETRYVLLLWLSMIVLIPFDLSTVDSSADPSKSIIRRMLESCKAFFRDAGAVRDGAAVLAARLLTRPDLRGELDKFLAWASQTLSSSAESGASSSSADAFVAATETFLTNGIYTCLCHILKMGSREELLPRVHIVLQLALRSDSSSNNGTGNTLQRKLSVKLAERLGLTFLKPRVVSWRYQRGSRSLLANLKSGAVASASASSSSSATPEEDGEEEEFEIPEEMEEIVEMLLTGLRDKDTIVRWSAAKGLGRITGRLSMELADQVVEGVLQLFESFEGDGAWHGGCLALAELARRGLLLPSRLATVVPFILHALSYDVQRATYSVGAHVRDAACYVCWAFARAYDPKVMAPFVDGLAVGLLTTAVFDREVNCRRAAAAAFQENVGRQGSFPHGIDILTTADYFTLCNRNHAYLDISVFVAQFEAYRRPFIQHLMQVKLRHWEQGLRELSARALGNLVKREPDYFVATILPQLIPLTINSDLNIRHGAIHGVAEVILGLSNQGITLDEALQKQVYEVVFNIERLRLYRGKGGEIMRGAVCRLIECMALCHLPLPSFVETARAHGPGTLKVRTSVRFFEVLEENLKHPNEDIVEAAARSLLAFAKEYFTGYAEDVEQKAINKILEGLKKDDSPVIRRGYPLALGSLPKNMLLPRLNDIFTILCKNIQIEADVDKRDAESRRNGVKGLIQVLEKVGVTHSEEDRTAVPPSLVSSSLNTLLGAMQDYCTDNRGDVGSWVREAAMDALERFSLLLCTADASASASSSSSSSSELFTSEVCQKIISCITQQACEKIDRVRDVAGKIFSRLFRSTEPVIKHFPSRDVVQRIIFEKLPLEADWSAPSLTFPLLTQLMAFEEYRRSILTGIIISVGGLTDHVVRFSSSSLIQFLRDAELPLLFATSETIATIFRENQCVDRVTVPVLKTLDILLTNGCLDRITPDSHPFTSECYDLTKTEIRTTKEVSKIMTSINVFAGLLKFGEPTRSKALGQLILMLANRYPKVRKLTGQQFYTALLVQEDLMPADKADDLLAILSDTAWDNDIKDVKEAQGQVYDLFGIAKPEPAAGAAASSSTGKAKSGPSESTYRDLIQDIDRGY